MKNRGQFSVALAVAILAVVFLTAIPSQAADPVIKRGIDTFTTTANGKTHYDFAQHPIPAGFFCPSSAAFTGRVAFRGLPLGVNGQLHNADTVIERLDDAVFAADHTAVTRLQVRALSMVSLKPIRTSCGAFHLYVSLAGPQRVTKMTLSRTEAGGGTFSAPLAIDARLTFIPVKPSKNAPKLEMTGSFTFPAAPKPWSLSAGAATKKVTSVVVDTNGDLVPDTRFSGSPNFYPGWPANGVVANYCTLCEPESCHVVSGGETHCTGPIYACGENTNCP
ncbi:MAG TPA: hypothetical protein VN851_21550 [Thermoanaerobaculia bacterium]|nr:hypothetical protein [Thermoanaerobaculia bacterium]